MFTKIKLAKHRAKMNKINAGVDKAKVKRYEEMNQKAKMAGEIRKSTVYLAVDFESELKAKTQIIYIRGGLYDKFLQGEMLRKVKMIGNIVANTGVVVGTATSVITGGLSLSVIAGLGLKPMYKDEVRNYEVYIDEDKRIITLVRK